MPDERGINCATITPGVLLKREVFCAGREGLLEKANKYSWLCLGRCRAKKMKKKVAFFEFKFIIKGLCWRSSMVEQLICNQQVAGSIPIASSTSLNRGEVPERPKGADCKSVGNAFGGSNPPLSTSTY